MVDLAHFVVVTTVIDGIVRRLVLNLHIRKELADLVVLGALLELVVV